jgi:hypothetical protein
MAPIGPKMGLCGGPIFVTFCEPFGLILTSAARTKRKKKIRPTPGGSRQVVYQARKTIAFCKFTELMQESSA